MNRVEFYLKREQYEKNLTEGTEDSLQHYGIPKMKWGVRRWQNADGTFNEAGKERYFGKGKKIGSTEDKVGGKDKKQKFNLRTGEYYNTKYQNPDGTLTKKGEKLLKRYIEKPNGFFSNVNGEISIAAYNKATGNNVVDRKKEEEKAKHDKMMKDLKAIDNAVTVKYDLKGDEITQEEFDQAANELKNTFKNMRSWDKEYNEIADLGLYKMIKNNTLDNDCEPGKQWDRFWFMEEDQTDGYKEVVDLYRKGYSRDYITQFANKLGDMDYEEAEEISPGLSAAAGRRPFSNQRRYSDYVIFDIFGPEEDQKVGSLNPFSKRPSNGFSNSNSNPHDEDNKDNKNDTTNVKVYDNRYYHRKEVPYFNRTVKNDELEDYERSVKNRFPYAEIDYGSSKKSKNSNSKNNNWDYFNEAVAMLGLNNKKKLSSADWNKINKEILKLKS